MRTTREGSFGRVRDERAAMRGGTSTAERHRAAPGRQRSSEEPFRLLVVSGRPMVHAFFAGLGRRSTPSYAVTQFPVEPEAVAQAGDDVDQVSAAVIDAGLDSAAAILVCQELHDRHPALPMAALVCCPHCITPWALRALIGTGVSSVVDLEATAEEAARALESVALGGSVLRLQPRHGHKALLRDILAASGPRDETQIELLELVASGRPDHEIGARLHISPHTVKHHIEQLRHQVAARNRIELAAWAGRHGFYRPEC